MWNDKDSFFLTWCLNRQKYKNLVKYFFINFNNCKNLPPESQSFDSS